MRQYIVPLFLAATLAACEGTTGKDNPFQPDPEESDETEQPVEEGAGLNAALAVNVTSVGVPGTDSIEVSVTSLDGTPLINTFARNKALDIGDYVAYTAQEDPLDRMFVALAAQSADGAVHAATVGDGGQFNRFLGGGFYERDGAFTPPAVGDGPGAGQVSYAGGYAGVTNISTENGTELLPIPPGTDLSTLPDLPGQPFTVAGTIFLNANFADNAVNGEIYNRVLIDPSDGSRSAIEDVSLIVTEIDANGEFFGDVEVTGVIGQDRGDYGGIFGGTDASSVAGLVSMDSHIEALDNEVEYGVFVLTQCGMPDDATVCDLVAP